MTTQNLPASRRTCTKVYIEVHVIILTREFMATGRKLVAATNVLSQSIEQSFKYLSLLRYLPKQMLE